ncbi:MAG: hypothetical protein KBS59_05110 [Clostridiales bacterium]|nr:hypothetical protein [Clostridiales bacterium]
MKLLCIGNSITFHERKEEIGWLGNWGMAASSPDKDYAHVLASLLEKSGKNVELRAINASVIEREPDGDIRPVLDEIADFNPDCVVIRLSENNTYSKRKEYIEAYEKLVTFVEKDDRALFIVGAFWKNDELDAAYRAIAKKHGAAFVCLSDIQGDEYKAIGQFENPDVARHPSDRGMAQIAEHIFSAMKEKGLVGSACVPQVPDADAVTSSIRLTCNGVPAAVRTCRVSAVPFNREWPGHQRKKDQTETGYFVTVGIGAGADFAVTYDTLPKDLTLRPSRLGLSLEVKGNTACFTVRRPGYYTLEGNGRKEVLHILASPTLFRDDKEENYTYYFGAGTHNVGKLRLHNNESVYIDADAVVYGSLYAKDAENIRIYGAGVLDGSKEERHTPIAWTEDGLVNLINCKNVSFEGITLRDSCFWNISLYKCSGVTLDYVKILGQWRYNTDGIDTVNSTGVTIRNCFLRTFDDTLVFKGLRLPGLNLEERNVTDCRAENCTLWCDWGGASELGAETIADEYHDLTFKNIDILRNADGALRIHSGDRAELHHITYENVYVEYTPYDLPQVLQKADGERYPADATPQMPPAIRGWMMCNVWTKDGIFGKVHDFS